MQKTVQRLLPAGILRHFKHYHDSLEYRKKAKMKNLKVITIDDSRFLFTMWMATLGISLMILLLEMCTKICYKILKNILGLILMLSSMRKFQ